MRGTLTLIFALLAAYMYAQTNLLPDTLIICTGDSGMVEVRSKISSDVSIEWRTPYGEVSGKKRVKASRAGKYAVRVSSSAGQQMDSCYVRFLPKPRKLLRDTLICKGRAVQLNAGNGGSRFRWNTGENSQKISVSNPGQYTVRISNGVCTVIDTVIVRSLASPPAGLNQEMVFCMNEDNKIVTARSPASANVTWNTGATGTQLPVNKEGIYWARSLYPGCGEMTDTIRVRFRLCECEMMIPNSFTPNEDGKNDSFFPVSQCEYSYYMLTISDRWGNVIFTTNSTTAKWDGRFKGNLCPDDIYIYRIETVEKQTEKKQVRNGHISLFR